MEKNITNKRLVFKTHLNQPEKQKQPNSQMHKKKKKHFSDEEIYKEILK